METFLIMSRIVILVSLVISSFSLFNLKRSKEIKELDILFVLLIVNIAMYGLFSEVKLFYFVLAIVLIVIIRMSLYYFKLRNNKHLIVEDVLLIRNGKLNFKELINKNIDLNSILLELKRKRISSIEEVELAFFDKDELIVFKRHNDLSFPIPIIVDGIIFDDTLNQIRRSREWLFDNIATNRIKIDDIIYGFYKNDRLVLIKKENMT